MKRTLFAAAVGLVAVVLSACAMTLSVTYTLNEVDDSGVSGTVTITKVDDATTRIEIDLTGTPAGGLHPAHIHEGDIVPGGGIYISLTSVDGDTGKSSTTITETDASDPITYEEIIAYDGYVNIHLSAADLGTIVANGEVGAGAN